MVYACNFYKRIKNELQMETTRDAWLPRTITTAIRVPTRMMTSNKWYNGKKNELQMK